MPESEDLNSLYQEWLEIPADRLPPNLYALLGVADFETDTEIIQDAAKKRSAYLHQIASGPQRKIVQDMLGQVAIARRTLLSEESRSAYDASLRNPETASSVTDVEANHSATQSVETTQAGRDRTSQTGGAQDSDSKSTKPASKQRDLSPAKQRQKKAEWKIHAASAAGLLGLVLLIWFLNKDGGGRRAAQAPATPSESAKATPAKASPSKKQTSKANAPVRRTTSVTSDANRKPAAKKRPSVPQNRTSSGLGSGLGKDMSAILSDISENPNTPAGKSEKGKFVPLGGGVTVGPVRRKVTDEDWPTDLKAIQNLSETLQDQFESKQGFDWFDFQENRLIVATAKDKNWHKLNGKSIKLKPGDSISFQTSLTRGMRREVQVGIDVSGYRIGVRPQGKNVEVFVRDKGDDSQLEKIKAFKSEAGPVTLLVQRDEKQHDRLNWFVKNGKTQSAGHVLTSGDESPAEFGIVVVAPKGDQKTPLWVGNLRVPAAD